MAFVSACAPRSHVLNWLRSVYMLCPFSFVRSPCAYKTHMLVRDPRFSAHYVLPEVRRMRHNGWHGQRTTRRVQWRMSDTTASPGKRASWFLFFPIPHLYPSPYPSPSFVFLPSPTLPHQLLYTCQQTFTLSLSRLSTRIVSMQSQTRSTVPHETNPYQPPGNITEPPRYPNRRSPCLPFYPPMAPAPTLKRNCTLPSRPLICPRPLPCLSHVVLPWTPSSSTFLDRAKGAPEACFSPQHGKILRFITDSGPPPFPCCNFKNRPATTPRQPPADGCASIRA